MDDFRLMGFVLLGFYALSAVAIIYFAAVFSLTVFARLFLVGCVVLLAGYFVSTVTTMGRH